MRRAGRQRWGTCRTLDDLCAVTAAWLRGEVRETPTHLAPPARETIPLIPVLEAVNLAGFLTDASQPGIPPDSGGWEQRAAVEGFATGPDMEALAATVGPAGLYLIAIRASSFRTGLRTRTDVTRHGNQVTCAFGARQSRRYLRWAYGGVCEREAVRAVCDAWQVTIIDLEWGRNDRLWPALERFARERRPA